MKLTFYGGVREIGGNQILLEDKGTRVFLDFGKNYNEAGKYFEEFLQPRSVHGIKDYLELGLIPKIEGIYRKDLIEILKREEYDFYEYTSPKIDGVLLSHAHLDHAGYVSFLDEKIPVFCSEDTKLVLEVLSKIRPSKLENEIVEISFPRYEDDRRRRKIKRDFKIVKHCNNFKIKDLEICAIPIDHSVSGAVMFLIKGSRTILYSGDFRLSEIPNDKLNEICDFLRKQKINYFLCEGTRVLDNRSGSEEDIYKKVKEIVQKVKGLIVADYSLTDIKRFKTLYRVAKETERKLALPFNYFGFVHFLKEKGISDLEDLDLDNIVLYERKKSQYMGWEKELIQRYKNKLADSKEISKNKKDYFVILNYYQIQELIDLCPDKNSYFLRAITEPHNEEMEFSEQRLINWIKHFQMQGLNENGELERAHISGHISGEELREFIKKVNPDYIIPIHTEQPEKFRDLFQPDKVIIVQGKGCEVPLE